jgi:hypothetical protein
MIQALLLFLCLQLSAYEVLKKISDPTLERIYRYYEKLPERNCDICEHAPLLRKLARDCESVTEIGVGPMISTWAILKGLSENEKPSRRYKGIDVADSPADLLRHAQKLSLEHGIHFTFEKKNDLEIEFEPVDFLFIDSMHTYCHLMYELKTFSPKVAKYIAMHDTAAPWGHRDDDEYRGNYSEYPKEFDRNKRGLWPAVVDFLKENPEWELQEHRTNCHGFTILKRKGL